MTTIHDQIDVAAPSSAVWEVLADVRRLPEFSSSTVEVSGAPDQLRRSGDRFTQVVRSVGRNWRSEWTVVDLEPGTCISSEGSVAPGVKIRLTQQVETRGEDSCRLCVEIRYRVPGGPLGRFVGKAGLERRAANEAREVLAGVRAAAEARQGPGDLPSRATAMR